MTKGVAAPLRLVVGEDDEADEFDVAILRLKPGDVLVFRAPGEIRQETVERIKQYTEDMLAELGWPNVKIMVLGDGLDISVIRNE